MIDGEMIEGEWRTANGEWIAILKSQNPNRGMIDGGGAFQNSHHYNIITSEWLMADSGTPHSPI